jgi:hypothetical protein
MLESDEFDAEVLADTMEAVDGEYEYKIEQYCKVIKNLEADMDALKNEAKRLSDRRKVLENNVDRLKAAMFDSMKVTGKTKVKGAVFTAAIQKNGGKLPLIVADDVTTDHLPDQLVIVTEKPNLEAIRELLEAGKVVEGFTLGERGESLRIK